MGKKNLLKGIVLLLGMISLSVSIYTYIDVEERIAKIPMKPKLSEGNDQDFTELVSSLESDFQARRGQEVKVTKDPLKIDEIVEFELIERLKKARDQQIRQAMRLNLTMVDPGDPAKSSAVIKYNGKNVSVKLGDKIDGYDVAEISSKEVVLKRGGGTRTLHSEVAGEAEKELDQLMEDLRDAAYVDNPNKLIAQEIEAIKKQYRD